MDGFSTYVLSYQDAAGNIWTSRIITNNPEAQEGNRAKLEHIYKELGFELLTVDKVEELATTPEANHKAAWQLKAYRFALMATLWLTLFGVVYDYAVNQDMRQYWKETVASTKVERDRLTEGLERHDRLLARMEARIIALESKLDAATVSRH